MKAKDLTHGDLLVWADSFNQVDDSQQKHEFYSNSKNKGEYKSLCKKIIDQGLEVNRNNINFLNFTKNIN
jgi:hypothetical protein